MMLKPIILAGVGVVASAAVAVAADFVSQATGYDDFTAQFCAASRDNQHIFVVPSSVFTDHTTLTCSDGDSTLRTSEPGDDPGHTVFNIDPPHGVEDGFDCDGKADMGMSLVALNCLPANMEQADHEKS